MKLVVNDQLVSYSDEGAGPVLVILHGWGASLQTFDTIAKRLSGRFRVIRLDLPGFGQSPKPPDSWFIDDYAHFIASFLSKLGVLSVYAIIGHSFGGRITLKAVGKGYIIPQKVVLIGSAGIKPSESAQKLLYKSVAKVGKQIAKLPLFNKLQVKLRRRLYESAGSTDYLEADTMRTIFLHTIAEDLQADAANIKQPCLLIWGENDDATPVADGRILHSAIRDSQFVVVSRAGHFVYTDKPDEVTKIIEDFL